MIYRNDSIHVGLEKLALIQHAPLLGAGLGALAGSKKGEKSGESGTGGLRGATGALGGMMAGLAPAAAIRNLPRVPARGKMALGLTSVGLGGLAGYKYLTRNIGKKKKSLKDYYGEEKYTMPMQAGGEKLQNPKMSKQRAMEIVYLSDLRRGKVVGMSKKEQKAEYEKLTKKASASRTERSLIKKAFDKIVPPVAVGAAGTSAGTFPRTPEAKKKGPSVSLGAIRLKPSVSLGTIRLKFRPSSRPRPKAIGPTGTKI